MLAADTFTFLEDVRVSRTPDEIAALLYREITRLGFTGVSIGWLPEAGSHGHVEFDAVSVAGEFHCRYARKHYERHSPVVRHMRKTSLPFVRGSVSYDPVLEPMAHRVMTEARDFGIDDAWVVPVYLAGHLRGWVCTFSENPIIPNDKLRQLNVMALWAHAQASHLREIGVASGPKLSPREVEVVSWLANGKTADDIASILNLSPRTVEYHIANAGLKLGTSNRTHTVVEAIRLRQILI